MFIALAILVPLIASAALITYAMSRADDEVATSDSPAAQLPSDPLQAPPTTARDVADFIDRPWERIELPGGNGTVEFPTGSQGETMPVTSSDGIPLSMPVRFVGTGGLMTSDHGLLIGTLSGFVSFDKRAGAEGILTGARGSLTDYQEESSAYGSAARFRGSAGTGATAVVGYVLETRRSAIMFIVMVPADQADVGELTLQRMVTSLRIG